MTKPEPTIEELKALIAELENDNALLFKTKRRAERMLEACLEVIKHLQNRA